MLNCVWIYPASACECTDQDGSHWKEHFFCGSSLKSNLMSGAVHDHNCKLEPTNEHLSNMSRGRKCSDSVKSVMHLSPLYEPRDVEWHQKCLLIIQSNQTHIFWKSTGPSQSQGAFSAIIADKWSYILLSSWSSITPTLLTNSTVWVKKNNIDQIEFIQLSDLPWLQ